MLTRRVAFWLAGMLWLGLAAVTVLTVFGTVLGVALAWFVGVRRSVAAARIGAVLGVLLLLPGQVILEMSGCSRGPCSSEPYLLALGLPLLVAGLNLAAAWPDRRPSASTAATPTTVAQVPRDDGGGGSSRADEPEPAPAGDEAPGQQLLWGPPGHR